MGCCNILTGYTPPRFPPSLNDYPLYIDRLHKEVWYWTGSSWELVWQVNIAGAGTLGVVKVSPSSPITIDAEGNLDIDCGRLKTQCKLATKADIDAAIAIITTAINNILTRLGDLETKVRNLTVTVTDLGRRITIVEGSVTDLSRRVTVVEGSVTDLGRRITVVEGDVTDLSRRVTVVEGAVANLTITVTDLGRRITIVEGSVTDLGRRITIIEGSVTDLGRRVTVIEGDITTIKGAITTINTRITDISNGSNVLAADITALRAKDIYLEDLINNLNPRVDYAVTSSGTAKTSISGYTVSWSVFSSPNSNIKKFYGSVCVLPSAEVISTSGVERVEFAIPATSIVSGSTSIGSYISPSVPTATMGFDCFVANGNLGVMFKHVLGTLLGCHGHRICVEFI